MRFYLPFVAAMLARPSVATTVFEDNFDNGAPFEAFPIATGTPYFHFLAGEEVFNDGKYKTEDGALIIKAKPFTKTFPLVPGGGLDHVKSLQYLTTTAPFASIPVAPSEVLTFSAKFGGEMYNPGNHPFGDAVTDAEDDIRLGR